ncbi:MAG: hypothetical protein R3Y11_11390 [Pseudomonadota bacterium]
MSLYSVALDARNARRLADGHGFAAFGRPPFVKNSPASREEKIAQLTYAVTHG